MLEGISPVYQAALGTLFTWGLTAAGSALVFLFTNKNRYVLDGSLGFAAGVMTAASFWSLLQPAIETATESQLYGTAGEFAFIPVAIGFIAGAAFVYFADKFMPNINPVIALSIETNGRLNKDSTSATKINGLNDSLTVLISETSISSNSKVNKMTRRRGGGSSQNLVERAAEDELKSTHSFNQEQPVNYRRISLLILAIVVHNIPEGLAVGVAFGAIGKSPSASFAAARNLAIGIGIQNFPEGLAVSLPLRGSGMSTWKSFWYGQLSGMVEPIAGILGAFAVVIAEPLLPYTLAFAAGAMIYVVFDDIIPEAQICGNGKLASVWSIVGFVVMMSLDVGLG